MDSNHIKIEVEIKIPKRWGELSPGSYFTEKRERERGMFYYKIQDRTGENTWGQNIRVNLSLSKPCPSV